MTHLQNAGDMYVDSVLRRNRQEKPGLEERNNRATKRVVDKGQLYNKRESMCVWIHNTICRNTIGRMSVEEEPAKDEVEAL